MKSLTKKERSNEADLKENSQFEDEIDVREVLLVVWKERLLLLLFSLFFGLLGGCYAFFLPDMYKSSAVLVAVESNKPGFSSLGGQFGGLASLAGFSLPGSSSDQSAEALEIMKSWGFIESFINEEDILDEVFAATGWSPDSRELIYDTGLLVTKSKVSDSSEADENAHASPVSSWERYVRFLEYLSISQDKKSGFITLSIEYYSPELAKKWVDRFVVKINRQLREKASLDAMRNIEFLTKKVRETNISSMQDVFYELIEEQTKTLMLAEGSQEYVFRTISQAREPEKTSAPNRLLIIISMTVFGAVFGAFFVFLKSVVRGVN